MCNLRRTYRTQHLSNEMANRLAFAEALGTAVMDKGLIENIGRTSFRRSDERGGWLPAACERLDSCAIYC